MTGVYPIPAEALDDRLAWVGTSGSGKTYNAGTAIERVLATNARAVICDPLGVWYGLRLKADGKTPAFPVVIFGGPHGDLPLNEHAGALIGEASAAMAESCIVDLSEIGTAAGERRFMLGFLRALYQKATGEPLHLVLDEADMWAPQTIRDKDGDANKLFAITERIVRRGRISGFIPWMITQRPAALSKDVLSQVDGLVAMTLTSSQDRDALDAWIGGQADRAEGQRIKSAMPTLLQGQGVVWIPRRRVLETAQFPLKATFDSSRTPKRGETRSAVAPKPLDVEALKGKLASLETETKANDPRVLKAEITRLKADLAKATNVREKYVAPSASVTTGALADEIEAARKEGERVGIAIGLNRARTALDALRVDAPPISRQRHAEASAGPKSTPAPVVPSQGVTGPQQRILNALAWWKAFGIEQPTNEQVGFVAGYSPGSGGFANLKGGLRGSGLVIYPAPGALALTDAGSAAASAPEIEPNRDAFHAQVRAKLSGPQVRLLDPILAAYPAPVSSTEVADIAGYSASSGGFANLRGSMRSIGLIDYPSPGYVRAADWLFPEGPKS